jgi:hypothetical protein
MLLNDVKDAYNATLLETLSQVEKMNTHMADTISF